MQEFDMESSIRSTIRAATQENDMNPIEASTSPAVPQAAAGTDVIEKIVEEVIEKILDEVIDLEAYAREGRKPPRARHYLIRIDKQTYKVSVPSMTGRQLLELAGKTPPTDYILRQIHAGGRPEKIGLDEVVDFTTPCIEKFKTMPRNAQDG
jgi:Multiubiquitin